MAPSRLRPLPVHLIPRAVSEHGSDQRLSSGVLRREVAFEGYPQIVGALVVGRSSTSQSSIWRGTSHRMTVSAAVPSCAARKRADPSARRLGDFARRATSPVSYLARLTSHHSRWIFQLKLGSLSP